MTSCTIQDGMLVAGNRAAHHPAVMLLHGMCTWFHSCFGDATKSRNKLILPAICSLRLYVIDISTDQRALRIFKVASMTDSIRLMVRTYYIQVIDGGELKLKAKLSFPHTETHAWPVPVIPIPNHIPIPIPILRHMHGQWNWRVIICRLMVSTLELEFLQQQHYHKSNYSKSNYKALRQ